jgi:membrane-associated phospholipid phosphatase
MQTPSFPHGSSRRGISLFLILCAGVIFLIGVTPYDYRWTLYFSTHKLQGFAEFMNRSIFNGDPRPGAGDFLYPLLFIALLLYFVSWQRRYDQPKDRSSFALFMAAARPVCGFILTSAFCSSLLFTHTVKQIVGRARPGTVFSGKAPFSVWYHTGPLFFTHGSYTGSFPSGHTATAAMSIIFAYALIACLPKEKRWISGFFLVFSVGFTILMGISRMMSASHWLTDVVFTLFSQWAIIHIIFYYFLNIPQKQEYIRRRGRPQQQPRFLELRICLFLIPICLGIWAFFTGLRSYYFAGFSWLLALTPAGLIGTLFFLHLAQKKVFDQTRTRINNKK